MHQLVNALHTFKVHERLAKVTISHSCLTQCWNKYKIPCIRKDTHDNHKGNKKMCSFKGCGGSRNVAISKSIGNVLIFVDADDRLKCERVSVLKNTLELFSSKFQSENVLIGSDFIRIPKGSTPRYEAFHRSLKTDDMLCYAFRDMPIIMPTLGCYRSVIDRIGGFREGGNGSLVSEDLELLYDHLLEGGKLIKVNQILVEYRHHEEMTSMKLSRSYLMSVRVKGFEKLVLKYWNSFSIWGAGRDGKAVFRMLSSENQEKVKAFLDIDPVKIQRKWLHRKQIMHFSHAVPPIACCVALDRTNGDFERNVKSIPELIPGQNLFFLV
eukprot:CAMPEP_0182443810 /NCGR_PEP_ID=MMETSP1172-20130603/2439_1 /TAXON_ID=708627 /ORGANISM="Timspurckia oligopyrenoides, Strain CCMP3278" /LENGTH=324 /DNA_ID=CAMNT_0024639191 /DNA_START=253 /DNA_END=1227 /DNA_ORIENTATION=+